MAPRWTREQAMAWRDSRAWIRGCNYMSADCHNRVDQWQEYGFEERLSTTDRELAAAAELGFNSVRLILNEPVWEMQHDGFMQRLNRYLNVCASHVISAMICFGNDCCVPKAYYKPPVMGPQTCDIGYHGGRKNSQHGSFPGEVGYCPIDEEDVAERWYSMVEEIIGTYASDPRVIIWDMYNEPGGNNRALKCLTPLRRFFEIARSIDPVQPLTVGYWGGPCKWKDIEAGDNELVNLIFENSDVISFHNYADYETIVREVMQLKKYGRPLLNTEWLNRITHNDVFSVFPLYALEKVGCYCWGLVAGLYQTYEPWESLWKAYENGRRDIDLTKWQHDLLRPSLRPYDPAETELIKRWTAYADGADNLK